jgi:two-component system sensor histidine kinase AlgZ
MTSPPPAPASEPPATRPATPWLPTEQAAPAFGSGFDASQGDPWAERRSRERALADAALDVCRPALAARALLLVQGVLALAALIAADGGIDWALRQAQLAFAGALALLLWLVSVCALRGALRRAAPPRRATVLLGLGALAALAGWAPLIALGLTPAPHALRVAGVAGGGAALAAMLWAWLELRARLWLPSQAEARLAELQSRIRPHFLFNALNTALALVRHDPARAEQVLEDLAELFRVALAEPGAAVSLADEIELARRYLAIEQARHGARLDLRWQVDDAALGARVPPLVLQPLVENAVRHGVEPAPAGGVVEVRVEARRAQVVVTVSNTLPAEPSVPGRGMALANVRERLRLLHDIEARCDAGVEGGRFVARLVVPLR